MSDSTPTSELIDRLVKQSGIRKKLAAELLYAIPVIIEEGLKRDGEVRVKGLGTFRMKWTQARPGRNPKTGESVEIPPRYRLVFLPEQSLKEFINRDFRLLSYKVIPGQEEEAVGRRSEVEGQWSEVMPEPVVDAEAVHVVPSSDRIGKEIENDFGSEIPARKRRIHWIIPAAISVIIVLSLVFYFRNFYPVGGRQSAVGGQQSAVGSWQLADSIKQLADSIKQLADSTQQSIIRTKSSQIDNRQSTIDNRQSSVTISEGQHLFKLSREVYGNPFLWVLIYKANQDLIPDPDQAISGKEIKIPVLEGTPDHLSRNDSLEISEGYRLVYEFYKVKGDDRSDDYFKGSVRYKPQ